MELKGTLKGTSSNCLKKNYALKHRNITWITSFLLSNIVFFTAFQPPCASFWSQLPTIPACSLCMQKHPFVAAVFLLQLHYRISGSASTQPSVSVRRSREIKGAGRGVGKSSHQSHRLREAPNGAHILYICDRTGCKFDCSSHLKLLRRSADLYLPSQTAVGKARQDEVENIINNIYATSPQFGHTFFCSYLSNFPH